MFLAHDAQATPTTERPTQFARSWRIPTTNSHGLDAQTIDEISTHVLPQIAALPGYLGGYLLQDRDSHTLQIITLWDSDAHRSAADVKTRNAAGGIMVVTSGSSTAVELVDVLISHPPA